MGTGSSNRESGGYRKIHGRQILINGLGIRRSKLRYWVG